MLHDSAKLIEVMENISDHLDDSSVKQITPVYADMDYDARVIREYLRSRRHRRLHSVQKLQDKMWQNDYPEQLQQDKICTGKILCVAQVWIPQNKNQIRKNC